jgi:hypothetical protein
MVRPWAEAGYICYAVDVQHDGISVKTVGDGAIVFVESDVREFQLPAVDFAAGFGFPPCTDLAVSGARWFEDKGLRTLAEALDLVGATKETLAQLDAPWMLENPVSVLSTHWREPDYRFDPFEYTGYTAADEAYSKETWLWTGDGFRMPVTDGVDADQADDRIHKMPPSDERADKRAATPMGFARAVFLPHHHEDYARADSGTEQADLSEVAP